MLEFCTDKLNLPFAARRVFLEDGVEVFEAHDIPLDSEVYISTGENYKDPLASEKSKSHTHLQRQRLTRTHQDKHTNVHPPTHTCKQTSHTNAQISIYNSDPQMLTLS